MRVLHAAAEIFPLVKTGGLADVVAALPVALRAAGVDVRVLPGYRHPVLSGPYPDIDETETIWLVPGSPPPLS